MKALPLALGALTIAGTAGLALALASGPPKRRLFAKTGSVAGSSPPLLIGDSLGVGLAAAWPVPAHSIAVGGSRVSQWARFGTYADRLASALRGRPSVVWVSLGTNDIAGDVRASKLATQVAELVATARGSGASVRWIGPPSLPWPGVEQRAALLAQLRALKVPVFHSELATFERAKDGVHATAKGYREWARQLHAWDTGTTPDAAFSASDRWGGAGPAPHGSPPNTILAVPGVEAATPASRKAALDTCAALGLSVDGLAAVLANESRWRPWAVNGYQTDANGRAKKGPNGKPLLTAANLLRVARGKEPFFACGLLQLTRAANLPGFVTNTALLSILDMPAEEQFARIVKPFFARTNGPLAGLNPGEVYMLVFMPAHAHDPPGTVIGERDSLDAWRASVFRQNAGLDINHDRKITVGEVEEVAARQCRAAHGHRVDVAGKLVTA